MERNPKTGYLSVTAADGALLVYRKGGIVSKIWRNFGACAAEMKHEIEKVGVNKPCAFAILFDTRSPFEVVYGNELGTTYKLSCPGSTRDFGYYALYDPMGHGLIPIDGKLYKTPEGAANAGFNFFAPKRKN